MTEDNYDDSGDPVGGAGVPARRSHPSARRESPRRRMSPTRDQLDNLRTPLTEGERLVFEFFDRELEDEWEIYLQPHLNGFRPDFVLLHPERGIAVYEIKDWRDLSRYSFRSESSGASSLMFATREGRQVRKGLKENPLRRVLQYKDAIWNLHCPRLGKAYGRAAITAGVLLPFAPEEEVRALFDQATEITAAPRAYPHLHPICGQDAFTATTDSSRRLRALKRVFPRHDHSSLEMNADLAADLRHWLVEPVVSEEQRLRLRPNSRQNTLITTRTRSGFRRIRGPAGSGKSLVLAARAANLARDGREVLLVSYNITLLNYLLDLAVRWTGSGKTRRSITALHFHGWCKRVCRDLGRESDYEALPWREATSDSVLRDQLPRLVHSVLAKALRATPRDVTRYDAIMVDEGQDFQPGWWSALRLALRKDGEMLLVVDKTQDVYGSASSWTDASMAGAGFSGPWSELEISERLPEEVARVASEFAREFLPRDQVSLPVARPRQLQIPFPSACTLRWRQTSRKNVVSLATNLARAVHEQVTDSVLSFADVALLVDNGSVGEEIVANLEDCNVKCLHTFGNDRDRARRLKLHFYKGAERVKATTIHSFKGWEARSVVLVITQASSSEQLAAIYTGLTRVKDTIQSGLTVICSAAQLSDFGRDHFPDYLPF